MAGAGETTVRRLGPGDEAVIASLSEGAPRVALLGDERSIFLVAFHGESIVGFVFGYELPRRHGNPSTLFVYEVAVRAAWRGQGVATKPFLELERIARARGIREGFVLTEPGNEAANRLYSSLGGERVDSVMWDFAYA